LTDTDVGVNPNSHGINIRLNSLGQLLLFNGWQGSQVGNNSPALSHDTWYMIEFASGSTSKLTEARINGNTFATSSALTPNTINYLILVEI